MIFLLFLLLRHKQFRENAFQLGIWAVLFVLLTRLKAEQPRIRVSISGKKKTPFYSPNVRVRFGSHPAPCSLGVGRSLTTET
jgi:hypothetical protein